MKINEPMVVMYSASAKGCTQPGYRVQTRVHSHDHDFQPVPRDAMFSCLARVSPMDFPPYRSGDNAIPQM